MFSYSIAHWATFLTAAFLLNLSPGPDMAFILGQTAKRGISSGFSAMFGIWSGACIHVLCAALGLSALLATSAIAFSMVKWAGACYLIWLGIEALLSKGSLLSTDEHTTQKQRGNFAIFRQGILVSVLNPKVAIFFLAFLPQFVVPGAGPNSAQLFLHGFLIIVVAAFVEPPLILISGKLIKHLNNNPRISRWMDRGLGALFIGLGLKLATTER